MPHPRLDDLGEMNLALTINNSVASTEGFMAKALVILPNFLASACTQDCSCLNDRCAKRKWRFIDELQGQEPSYDAGNSYLFTS